MLLRDELLKSLRRETEIIKHLVTKVPDGGFDYRPTPGQRSTIELLRYISHCASGAASFALAGTWERYSELEKAAESLAASEIPAALDAQMEELTSTLERLDDEAFTTKEIQTPLGETMLLGEFLLEMPLKWMAAYRMQLFLYCKGAGNAEIWTPNLWGGVDMPRR